MGWNLEILYQTLSKTQSRYLQEIASIQGRRFDARCDKDVTHMDTRVPGYVDKVTERCSVLSPVPHSIGFCKCKIDTTLELNI